MKQDGGEELRERERERTKRFLVRSSLLLFFPFDAILLIYIDGGRLYRDFYDNNCIYRHVIPIYLATYG